MKSIVGIDASSQSKDAVEFIAALDKSDPEVVVAHVIPPVFSDDAGVFEGGVYPFNDIQGERAILGSTMIGEAEDLLREKRIPYQSQLRWGSAPDHLIQLAAEEGADLIAVGSSRKGELGSLFLGSVSRSVLAGSPVSVLVAKRRPHHSDGLVAVFATDHSAYSKKCLDELIRIAPSGIRRIVVLTANELDATKVGTLVHGMPELANEAERWITDRLRLENGRICERLTAICPECEVAVKEMPVEEAIRSTMAEHNADLLILGAQGHGFFERLMLGSVSFHQAVAEEYSVLILRPNAGSQAGTTLRASASATR